jgi:phosphate starvation-inducible PhoH-like protein
MKHQTASSQSISTDPLPKRSRKSKKQNEKEIMRDFLSIHDSATTVSSSSVSVEIVSNKFTLPKNNTQRHLSTLLRDTTQKIIFVTGPAGTGKTVFATEMGVQHLLSGTYNKLVFTRPNISVDEELGFLPGTLEEKLGPYMRPIYDILHTFITPKDVVSMMEDKIIEIAPLGFMRGRTFKNTWIVADEMQNATVSQMKMLLTRLGENSQLIITGDLDQSDMQMTNGLTDFLERWNNNNIVSKRISHVQFSHADILREPVVEEILKIYGSSA